MLPFCRGCHLFLGAFACLRAAITVSVFSPFHVEYPPVYYFLLFRILPALWASMRTFMRFWTSAPLIGCHYLSCASISLSPSLYPSASLLSGYRLWSTSLPLLLPFGFGQFFRGWVWVILVFGGPLFPHSSSLLPRLPIMRWYLCPLASAFLYTHPPYLDSIFSILLSFLHCVFFYYFLLRLPFPSIRRWRYSPAILCGRWRCYSLASCLSSFLLYSFLCCGSSQVLSAASFGARGSFLSQAALTVILSLSAPPSLRLGSLLLATLLWVLVGSCPLNPFSLTLCLNRPLFAFSFASCTSWSPPPYCLPVL